MNALAPPPAAVPFADGIYFGLDEAPYHEDPALGSSDLKTLYAEPAAYWHRSGLNPDRPADEDDSAHRIIGRAVHKFVLEGPQAFNRLYERHPEGDDLLRTSDDIGAWLKERGAKAPALKAARIAQVLAWCEAAGEAPPRILDVIAREAAEAGRTLIDGVAFDRIVAAGGAVLDNPHLADSFHGGASEVSIFWTEDVDGELVRRKARFDYLRIRAVVDLKSTRPRDHLPFVASCRRALAEWNYPTQAAAYLQGRAQLPRLVTEGRVFGDHDPAWLARVASAETYAFVFVFWASTGAPLTWGGVLSPDNPVLDLGRVYVRHALANYVAARRTHGLAAPWITHHPLEEIDLDDLPRWYGAA
ncbi:PD-(D/E)XK nuclease-like domain-containing protein [Methylobacterium aquaticum]|uniref:PD-(D/E)XK nuclease-like domain-containing protein n=1 Tax=Methylobacterium aquaticum TaxID=270351 RepID=UPI003D168C3D